MPPVVIIQVLLREKFLATRSPSIEIPRRALFVVGSVRSTKLTRVSWFYHIILLRAIGIDDSSATILSYILCYMLIFARVASVVVLYLDFQTVT